MTPAAPPSADLQEEVEGLERRMLRQWNLCGVIEHGGNYEIAVGACAIARDAIALLRRLSQPAPTSAMPPKLAECPDAIGPTPAQIAASDRMFPDSPYHATPPPPAGSRPEDAGLWRPIESAPRDGTEVLGICGLLYDCTSWQQYGRDYNGVHGWRDKEGGLWSPTHWMPLPPPPSEALSRGKP